MDDFISLTCPNCKGQLELSRTTISFICKYCGTEHMLRHDSSGIMIESFARCPRCSRNDKAQKLSGLNLKGTDPLFPNLSAPPKPTNSIQVSNVGCGAITWSILLFLFGIFILVGFFVNGGGFDFIIGFIIPTVIGCFILIPPINRKKREEESFYLKQKELNEFEIPAWEEAMKKWDKLYYCSRDDCVFIPGESQSYSSSQTRSFIYQKD